MIWKFRHEASRRAVHHEEPVTGEVLDSACGRHVGSVVTYAAAIMTEHLCPSTCSTTMAPCQRCDPVNSK